MKAIISKTQNQTLLTIGMIVKNEGLNLRQCLTNIKPLLQAVKCELIITDTGSGDDTVAIAKEFTDNIIYFKWCDDFAAARNTTIAAATGIWYMYLDADEMFDDSIIKIADFLKSSESDKYNTATFIVRNYGEKQHKTYCDFNATRIFRRFASTKFEGCIHEQIGPVLPVKTINAVAHHDGYIVSNLGILRSGKRMRNRPLLQHMLDEDPNNLRLYRLLADCYTEADPNGLKIKEELFLKGLSLSSALQDMKYYCSTTLELLRLYHNKNDSVKLEQLLAQYEEHKPEYSYCDIDIYFMVGQSRLDRKDFEGAIKAFAKHRKACDGEQNGKMNELDRFTSVVNFSSASFYNRSLAVTAFCYASLYKTQQAYDALKSFNPATTLDQAGKLCTLFYVLKTYELLSDLQPITDIYSQLLKQNESEFLFDFANHYETAFFLSPELKMSTSKLFLPFDVTNTFIAVNHLRAKQFALTAITADAWDMVMHDEFIATKFIYYDIYYAALQNPKYAFALWDKLDPEMLNEIITACSNSHLEFSRVVYNFLTNQPKDGEITINSVLWQTKLAESVLLNKNDYTNDEFVEIFKLYANLGRLYCQAVYNADVFAFEKNIDILPGWCRFVYYAAQAFSSLENGDVVCYLQLLRKALTSYETMREPVTSLFDIFKLTQRNASLAQKEFEQLAKEVKAQLDILIKKGDIANATDILSKYAQVNPSDPELVALSEKLL